MFFFHFLNESMMKMKKRIWAAAKMAHLIFVTIVKESLHCDIIEKILHKNVSLLLFLLVKPKNFFAKNFIQEIASLKYKEQKSLYTQCSRYSKILCHYLSNGNLFWWMECVKFSHWMNSYTIHTVHTDNGFTVLFM